MITFVHLLVNAAAHRASFRYVDGTNVLVARDFSSTVVAVQRNDQDALRPEGKAASSANQKATGRYLTCHGSVRNSDIEGRVPPHVATDSSCWLIATPDKAYWPPKWDEHDEVHVPFRYLGANGTTFWSVRNAASTWIRCESVGAPCVVSPARAFEDKGEIGVGSSADTGNCTPRMCAHGSIAAPAAVGKDGPGGSASS